MSSVANNHGPFSQQSLNPHKSSPSSNLPMAFYKRDSGGATNPDCYPMDVSSMRSRQPDYAVWSPLPNASQWTNVSCNPAAHHVGSLPAAHSLLSHPSKSSASTASTTVMTNQKGKTFTAPTSTAPPLGTFPRYEDQHQHQHQHYSPTYPLKRGSSYSGPRPTFLDNPTPGGMPHMEYADGQVDPYHSKSNPTFQPLTPDLPYNAYRYGNNQEEKAQLSVRAAKMPGQFHLAESMAVSPPASLASSDAETTASSSATRGASSLPASGAISTATSSVVATGSVVSQPKRPRKPAPTLATGRRNLKSEPVDPDEADRRMKRRERNRKSAQKCRERKLHRAQELQTQVDSLNMETIRLMHEVDLWREYCRKCVTLLRQHCPDVPIPILNTVMENEEGYLPPAPTSNVAPMDPETLSFCDAVEQTDVSFYNKKPGREGYGRSASTNNNTVNSSVTASAASSNSGVWNGRPFSQVTPQLLPLSQFVSIPTPTPTAMSASIKMEHKSGAFWKADEAMEPFITEVNHEGKEVEWKTENDTDSSSGCGVPPRLNTPNTNEADKANVLSSSL